MKYSIIPFQRFQFSIETSSTDDFYTKLRDSTNVRGSFSFTAGNGIRAFDSTFKDDIIIVWRKIPFGFNGFIPVFRGTIIEKDNQYKLEGHFKFDDRLNILFIIFFSFHLILSFINIQNFLFLLILYSIITYYFNTEKLKFINWYRMNIS